VVQAAWATWLIVSNSIGVSGPSRRCRHMPPPGPLIHVIRCPTTHVRIRVTELGGFNWSSQHLEFSKVRDEVWEAAVGGSWLSGATPVAGAADRGLAQDRVRFWSSIAAGAMTEDAAVEAEGY
jgi:hypothetical protein